MDDENCLKRVMLLYIYMHSMCVYIYRNRVYLDNCLDVVGCRVVFREVIMYVDCISTSVSGYCTYMSIDTLSFILK